MSTNQEIRSLAIELRDALMTLAYAHGDEIEDILDDAGVATLPDHYERLGDKATKIIGLTNRAES